MKNTITESIPETLGGLEIFLEEVKKEQNRLRRLELNGLDKYKTKSGKEYVYKNRYTGA